MTFRGVQVPSRATLAKYGMDIADWIMLGMDQGWVCAICGKLPESRRLCIDHFHAPKFARMKPEQKRQHVRGLACFHCNRYRISNHSLTSAAAVLGYLQRHQERTRI